jgi:hypothetical protein
MREEGERWLAHGANLSFYRTHYGSQTENQIEGEIGKEVSTECQIGKKFFRRCRDG